mmetsp:Transcript_8248/g.15014  ORF Transcript_8248/g.15014 Transcript_8248/m.15014 type:complete len:100 (+) Transcript_8248:49-348(+)
MGCTSSTEMARTPSLDRGSSEEMDSSFTVSRSWSGTKQGRSLASREGHDANVKNLDGFRKRVECNPDDFEKQVRVARLRDPRFQQTPSVMEVDRYAQLK